MSNNVTFVYKAQTFGLDWLLEGWAGKVPGTVYIPVRSHHIETIVVRGGNEQLSGFALQTAANTLRSPSINLLYNCGGVRYVFRNVDIVRQTSSEDDETDEGDDEEGGEGGEDEDEGDEDEGDEDEGGEDEGDEDQKWKRKEKKVGGLLLSELTFFEKATIKEGDDELPVVLKNAIVDDTHEEGGVTKVEYMNGELFANKIKGDYYRISEHEKNKVKDGGDENVTVMYDYYVGQNMRKYDKIEMKSGDVFKLMNPRKRGAPSKCLMQPKKVKKNKKQKKQKIGVEADMSALAKKYSKKQLKKQLEYLIKDM